MAQFSWLAQQNIVRRCPLMAQSGHGHRRERCPLLGAKRTFAGGIYDYLGRSFGHLGCTVQKPYNNPLIRMPRGLDGCQKIKAAGQPRLSRELSVVCRVAQLNGAAAMAT